MKLRKRNTLFFLALSLLPVVVQAQALSTFKDVAELFVQIIKGIINILFASLTVAMVYGVILYFVNSDNEQKRTEIKSYLLWGIIGITVVFGLWGILQILSDSMGWGVVGIPFISEPTP